MLNNAIARLVPFLPMAIVKRVAQRYIAGETDAAAIRLSRGLERQGFLTTIDILGEDTLTPHQASAAADAYLALMEKMSRSGAPLNVSLKLTQFGLRIDRDLAFHSLRRVLERARALGFFVRIDMEDSEVTDLTLEFHERAREIMDQVGTVLQARLRRTIADASRLAARQANIRLCRGVYKEPPSIAYTRNRNIRESYLETFRILTAGGSKVAVATHDLRLIARIEKDIAARGIPKQQVEFQTLLGVPMGQTLPRLRDQGYAVRIYVPFGQAWLAYSLRRLQENPEIATSVVKGLFKRGRVGVSLGE